MFTEEDGTTINNEDRKEFQIRKKMLIFSKFPNFYRALVEISVFQNCSQVFEAGNFLKYFLQVLAF